MVVPPFSLEMGYAFYRIYYKTCCDLPFTLVSIIMQAIMFPLMLNTRNMAIRKVKVWKKPPGSWKAGSTTTISNINTTGRKTAMMRKHKMSTIRLGIGLLRILMICATKVNK